jgi:hypothetical protein
LNEKSFHCPDASIKLPHLSCPSFNPGHPDSDFQLSSKYKQISIKTTQNKKSVFYMRTELLTGGGFFLD